MDNCKWNNWVGKDIKNLIVEFTDTDLLLSLENGEKVNCIGFHKITITFLFILLWIDYSSFYSFRIKEVSNWKVLEK